MMKYLLMFVATVAIASAIPRLEFGHVIGSGSSGSYYDGGNMTITCTDQPSSVGSLNGLSLLRLKGLERTGTVVYKYYVEWGNPDPLERWGRSDRRYTVDQKSFTANGAKFRITIQMLECIDDSAQYWCLAEGSGTGASSGNIESQRQNLSIAAAPNNMRMETYEPCRDISFGDNQVNCQQSGCLSMARYGEAPTFVCSGSVSGENARNYRFTWYRKKLMVEDELITERNVTQPTIDSSRNYRDCERITIRSTLTYGTQANDHNLEIECRLTDTRGVQYGTYNTSVSVCVTGLSTTPAPDSDADTGGGTSNAGMIAGIIIGVIALIVLVVLLVYFLWYRRRDEGETYNTKDENAMSSDPEKPENTHNAYDGNNFRQGRPRGYVSRHVDEDDDDSIKKPPPYGKDNPALDDDDFDNDVEVKPRATYHTGHQNPIGSAV